MSKSADYKMGAKGERIVATDAYYWRHIATPLSFVVFGLASVLLGVIAFPLLRLLPGDARRHAMRVRASLRGAMRLFIGFMRAMGVLTFEFHGQERLGRAGQIVIANHPTLIDVVFLIGFTPGATCVIKNALWRNPLTRSVVAAAGYISNRSTAEMIEQAAAALEDGQTVIIFPEGTRTDPARPLEFHRGAANIAMRSARIVTPVFIRCEPPALSRAVPWYRIPKRRMHLTFIVDADVDPQPFGSSAPRPRAAREFNDFLLRLFSAQRALP